MPTYDVRWLLKKAPFCLDLTCFLGHKGSTEIIYRTRAIITRSRFETALDYKPRIFKVRKLSM